MHAHPCRYQLHSRTGLPSAWLTLRLVAGTKAPAKKKAAGIEGVKKSDFLAKTTMTAALPNLFSFSRRTFEEIRRKPRRGRRGPLQSRSRPLRWARSNEKST